MLSISPDQLSAAGSYIARNWSADGYVIENITAPPAARDAVSCPRG